MNAGARRPHLPLPRESRRTPTRPRSAGEAVTIGAVLMRPTPELGDTLLVAGRPAVVVSLLPGRRRHEVTARCAYDLPCGRCGTPLSYNAAHRCARCWRRCSGCRVFYGHHSLAELARTHD